MLIVDGLLLHVTAPPAVLDRLAQFPITIKGARGTPQGTRGLSLMRETHSAFRLDSPSPESCRASVLLNLIPP